MILCRKDEAFLLKILAAEVFWSCITRGGEIMPTLTSSSRSTWEDCNLQRPLSYPAYKTWGNHLFSTPSSLLPCWQTCWEARILSTSLLPHQRMTPTWAPDEDKTDGPEPCQQPGRACTGPGQQHKHVWRVISPTGSGRKRVSAMAQPTCSGEKCEKRCASLLQKSLPKTSLGNLYLHEDHYVCRHTHQ